MVSKIDSATQGKTQLLDLTAQRRFSLLVPSLKAGRIQRLKLDATGQKVMSLTEIPVMNLSDQARMRDVCISSDGLKIYVACDKSSPLAKYQGKILEHPHTGPLNVLSIKPDSLVTHTTNKDILVFPNPASKILFVKGARNVIKPLRCSIYDVSGKLILSGSSKNVYFSVNIETLVSGTYIFKLFSAYDIDASTNNIIVE